MAERESTKPTINEVLFVSETDLACINHWPAELRAIFDPQADQELAEQVRAEAPVGVKQRPRRHTLDEDVPF
jgi:hypothetical protein